MKIFGFLLIITTLGSSNTFAQSLEDITSITFTKQTRGYLDEVIISRDSLQGFVENHRVPEETRNYATAVDQDGWARLMIALKDVPIENIDGLQSPTTNRAHDGALHSSIVITFSDGNAITHSFDDEAPHPDLQPLLNVILDMRIPTSR